MDVVIDLCGFVGAWLLFAGPIFQASLELGEFEIDRGGLAQYADAVPEEPPVSPWWWLVPPVAYALNRRRGRRRRDAIMRLVPPETQKVAFSFWNTSTGWLLVGMGAFFIAVKESYELGEALEWPHGALAPLIIVPFALSVAHTIYRTHRTQQLQSTSGTSTGA